MNGGSGIVIQNMWDVTVVNFEEARLLEAATIESISQELYRLVEKMDRKKLVLDFTKVQYLASAAVGMIMNVHKKSAAIKGLMIVVGLRKELMKVFEIMGLVKVLKFAPNEAEAMKLLGYPGGNR